jgi:hypothetical protein
VLSGRIVVSQAVIFFLRIVKLLSDRIDAWISISCQNELRYTNRDASVHTPIRVCVLALHLILLLVASPDDLLGARAGVSRLNVNMHIYARLNGICY